MEDASCLSDDWVAASGGRTHLPLEVGSVVPADVAPDDPAVGEQEVREKPLNNAGNHFLAI
ncbi:MAG: hypothetical protein QXY48_00995 [Sulfolobales archaeon]